MSGGRSRSRTVRKEGKSRKLEHQSWYHGIMPRDEITKQLKEHGQFLVRATEKGANIQIVISVMHKGRVLHVPISRDSEGWRLEDRAFKTVVDLIYYYYRQKKPLTKVGAVLGRAVKKTEWLVDNRNIREKSKVGEGQFGEVCMGKYRGPDGKWKRVAIKKCDKGAMTECQRLAFLKEAKLLLKFKHPNIVRLFGVAADKPPIRLILEYCPGGDLRQFLLKHSGRVPTDEKARFCNDAAKGMEYLAMKECVHRDLAARNCLIGRDTSVKISDFGMSNLGDYQVTTTQSRKVPVKWTAPEVWTTATWTSKSDVFGFGVLMWEIFADGETPWGDATNMEVMTLIQKGTRLTIPHSTPEILRNLMTKCWNENPTERPNFTIVRIGTDDAMRQQPSSCYLTTLSSATNRTQKTQRPTTYMV